MMGTVTKKTDPHQNQRSSSPLDTTPKAPPAPANAAHTAIALGRSCGGNTDVNSESVDGMMRAAAMPMIARPAMT